MAIDRPPQTRGFLFADLRGYSAFTERHGDLAARELLARYRRVVREVIVSFSGAEIRTEGDSFYIVFDSVSRAVRAGLAILHAVAEPDPDAVGHPITVGIGLHAGETEDSDEGIVSGAVNTAARICALAQPGELLVSDTVRSLTRTYLDVTFVPRGRRRLKGIAEPVALFSVGDRGDRVPGPEAVSWRREWRRPLVIGGGIFAMVVAGLGVSLSLEGEQRAVESPLPARQSVPPATEAVPTTTVSPEAGPFPSRVEQVLLQLVEEAHQPRCERALERDAPGIWFRDSDSGTTGPWVNEPVPRQGGITCVVGRSVGPDIVGYWQVPTATQRGMLVVPVELVRNHAGRRGVFPGGEGCAVTHRALEKWSFGGAEGLLLCYTTGDGDAILEWGYDDRDVFATAVRNDGDMAALLSWWSEHARFAP